MSRLQRRWWSNVLPFFQFYKQRYELETNTYMMEPWEKVLCNTVFLMLLYLILRVSWLVLNPVASFLGGSGTVILKREWDI